MISFFAETSNRVLHRGTTRGAIGIDAGSRVTKAVQLRFMAGGQPRIMAASCQPRADTGPLSANEAAGIVEKLKLSGFAGKQAIIAAPAAAALIGPVELPPRSSNAPLDQLARMEMARNFRVAPDSFEMAWWELPEGIRGGRGTHALCVGLPHAPADTLADLYEKSGLEITAIDAEPLALARACTPALAATGMTAILDMSWGPASLSLIHQGIVTFNRRIPDGAMGPLHASLGTTLGLEHDVIEYLLDEESSGTATSNEQSAPMPDVGSRLISSFVDAVVKELSLSFNYASNQYPHAEVSKLLLVGGGASMKDLATCLAALLKIEVVRVSPAELAACEPAMLSLCASPAMTLAFGLALRALA